MSNYLDDISGRGLCIMEGCVGRGSCPRCGETNYRLMGWFGAVASAAKRWGIVEVEAERRIIERQEAAGLKALEREEAAAAPSTAPATREGDRA